MKLDIYKRYLFTEHEAPRKRIKFKGKDNLHFSRRTIDGFNKTFNLIVSEREAGKSTQWTDFYSQNFQTNETFIALRRQIADCSETYIKDIEKILNKFSYVPIRLIYKTTDIDRGIVDVYVAEVETQPNEEGRPTEIFHNKRLFFRVLGMSNPMSRIKSLMIPNLRGFVFDEYICNLDFGEKYLTQEAFRFKEIFNTFQREAVRPLKVYFFGNPYSVYNPYHTWLGIDTRKIKRGVILTGKAWAFQSYEIKKELKELILKRNPLYEFDDAYRKYAFDGLSVQDMKIPVMKHKPTSSTLSFVLKVENTWLACYRIPPNDESKFNYYIEDIKWSKEYKRKCFCFDFSNMEANAILIQRIVKEKLSFFKFCIANNYLVYSKIDNSYLIQSIYHKL